MMMLYGNSKAKGKKKQIMYPKMVSGWFFGLVFFLIGPLKQVLCIR